VLYDIDYKKTENAFIALGYHNFAEMFTQYTADKLFEEFETGKITNENFYKALQLKNSEPVSEHEIKNAWNQILIGWRKESVHFLNKISTEYNIYLLSNTNAIHQSEFLASFEKETGLTNFNAFFVKPYYSHEIHLRKPNKNIFEFVLADANIIAEETLFIDDSYNNINTAHEMGFKTHLLLKGERIEDLDYESYTNYKN
jgi:glucose-1-phosphatase